MLDVLEQRMDEQPTPILNRFDVSVYSSAQKWTEFFEIRVPGLTSQLRTA